MLRASGEGGGSGREVVFRFKVAVDDPKSEIGKLKKQADDVQKHLNGTYQKGAAEQEKIGERVFRARAKMLDRIRRYEEQKAKESQRATLQMERDLDRINQARIRGEERSLRETLRNQERAARQAELAGKKQEKANKLIEHSLLRAADGALHLARGLALTGAVGEKDMQKVVDTLLKVQIAFDALKGGIAIIGGLTKAWKAYHAAVAAVAVAEASAAVAGGVAGVAGGVAGGARRAASGGFGRGVAAGALGVGAGRVGLSFGGRVISGVASLGGGSIAAGTGLAAAAGLSAIELGQMASGVGVEDRVMARLLTPVFKRTMGVHAAEEKFSKEQDAFFKRFAAKDDRFALEAATGSIGDAGANSRMALALEQSRFAAIRRSTPEAEVGAIRAERGLIGGRIGALTGELATAGLDRRAAIEQQVLGLRQQNAALLQKELVTVQQIKDSRLEEAAARQDALGEAQSQFGNLGRGQQQALLRATRKARAGDNLTRAQRLLLLQSGPDDAREVAFFQSQLAGGTRATELFGPQRAGIGGAFRDAGRITVDGGRPFDVDVNVNIEDLQKKLGDELGKVSKQIGDDIEKSLKTALEQLSRDIQRRDLERQGQQKAAGG